MIEERIVELMADMVALKSRTGTKEENLASDYIFHFIRELEYFREHPQMCGNSLVEGDHLQRHIPYGLIEGNSKNTVLLMGHFDVVDEGDYGDARELAFRPGRELEAALVKKPMTALQQEDMISGQWIWGKGTADMKGGLAIHMALLEEYSRQALEGTLEGSVLFLAVPDEESYSAGMRYGAKLLSHLKREYELNYKLLINPEPTDLVEGKQVMYLGTVGQTMPVVMVQGITSHIGHCFDGFHPLSILTGIFRKTNGSLDFVDSYEQEATMPPTWLKLRDLKEVYDVSVPSRASGYFTVLSLYSGPDVILNKLQEIAIKVCQEEEEKLEHTYEAYKKLNQFEKKEKLEYHPKVYTFGQLIEKLKIEKGTKFVGYYQDLYQQVKEMVFEGRMNFPDATEWLMGKVLDFANIKEPTVLLSFSPPYYPAVNGNEVEGKEGTARKAYQFAAQCSEQLGQPLTYQNFFMGISDNSYSSVPSSVHGEDIVKVTPLWGEIYAIDFMSAWNVNCPAIIYGPIGREYHKWSERVHRDSLTRIVPETTRKLISFAWNMD